MKHVCAYVLAPFLLLAAAGAVSAGAEVGSAVETQEKVASTDIVLKVERQDLATEVIRSYAGLLLVLALLAGGLYFGKRKGWLPTLPGVANAKDIEVVALRQVSPHLKVALISIDGRMQRVFFNEHSITVLEDGAEND